MKDPNLKQIQKRAFQYWYQDGLVEIAFGLLCFLLAAYFYLQETYPKDSPLDFLIEIGFIVIILGSSFLVTRLVLILKNRLTFPRTGYIAFHPKPKKRGWIAGLVGMTIGGLVSVIVLQTPASLNWMTAITGIIFALVWLYVGLRLGLLRFQLIALSSGIIGVWLSLAHLGDTMGLGIFYGLIGLLMLISGGITLWFYLRSTSPAQEDSHE